MRSFSLGAVPGEGGVTFSLWSRHAEAVELCLFDTPESGVENQRLALRRQGEVWSLRVPGIGPGQLYGYRVHGPFAPRQGHRFNPSKLLVDPWARAVTGEPRLDPSLFGSRPEGGNGLGYDSEDSASAMPKCVVVDPAFDWRGDRPPGRSWSESVIYETHVKGMTALHPEVPPELRGTYLGVASPPVVRHLLALGVTAVELLPVQQIASEPRLLRRGLRNYWGYSTLAYLAPHAGYATGARGEQVSELQTMVRTLHREGLEVILDVVYNHTAEGGAEGPTLSLRGIDNAAYYRLHPRDRSRYVDYTGCGNTLDLAREPARRLVLESLRYWVRGMHVDGFRFDLAPVLGREAGGFRPEAAFFREMAEDPDLARVKCIAEPWDLGPGGYRLGAFPRPWREWNDVYRDSLRRFWRGSGSAGELAECLAGSPRIFAASGRGPTAGISYVTSHDGFTLADLVAYEEKHNHANGEENRDGHDHELSRNWGVEGPAEDPEVLAERERTRRNLAASLFLSRGVPMLSHGDELGRTQLGNNNPYCHDSPLTWIDWSLRSEQAPFLAFLERLAELRRRHPELRPEHFATPEGAAPEGDTPGHATAENDGTLWLSPEGLPLTPAELECLPTPAFAFAPPGGRLLVLANGTPSPVPFHLPPTPEGWQGLLHTTAGPALHECHRESLTLAAYGLVVLERDSSKLRTLASRESAEGGAR